MSLKPKYFIDTHKGVTGIAILTMIAFYHQWGNPTAWVYLGMHGTYGLLWVLKSRIFPDKQWDKPCSLWYGLYVWAGLTLYWIAPWLITSRGLQAPPWLLGLGVSMFAFGVFFHFTADMQKHTALALNPAHLITDGLMALARNINYFGELLIYASYALLSMHWLPFAVIALYLALVWGPNIAAKERSLSRYPDFNQYRSKTRLIVPFIF